MYLLKQVPLLKQRRFETQLICFHATLTNQFDFRIYKDLHLPKQTSQQTKTSKVIYKTSFY